MPTFARFTRRIRAKHTYVSGQASKPAIVAGGLVEVAMLDAGQPPLANELIKLVLHAHVARRHRGKDARYVSHAHHAEELAALDDGQMPDPAACHFPRRVLERHIRVDRVDLDG